MQNLFYNGRHEAESDSTESGQAGGDLQIPRPFYTQARKTHAQGHGRVKVNGHFRMSFTTL